MNSAVGLLNLYTGCQGEMKYIPANYPSKAILPVKKGDVVRYQYEGRNASSSDNYFVFIYAEGEV